MQYPDGSPIRVGDLIWWDEGYCVGHVQVIAESPEEYTEMGLDSPHIFVSNNHPFDPALIPRWAYPATSLDDDGVGPLSAEERAEFDRATAVALSQAPPPVRTQPYSVTTDVQRNEIVGWRFTFWEGEGETVVTVPASPPPWVARGLTTPADPPY